MLKEKNIYMQWDLAYKKKLLPVTAMLIYIFKSDEKMKGLR